MSENYHENFFVSATWGVLDFIPTKSDKFKDTCKKCPLFSSKECLFAHCTSISREDEKNGYFSKHEMPKERETK